MNPPNHNEDLGGNPLNSEFSGDTRSTRIEERTLELIGNGHSTRKAKRQAEREARIYWKKVEKQYA